MAHLSLRETTNSQQHHTNGGECEKAVSIFLIIGEHDRKSITTALELGLRLAKEGT